MKRFCPRAAAATILLLILVSPFSAADVPAWVDDLSADARVDLRLVFERLDEIEREFADGTSRFLDRVHEAWIDASEDYGTLVRSLSDLGYSIQYNTAGGRRTQTVAASAMVRDIHRLESDILDLLAEERPLLDEPAYEGASTYLIGRLESLGLQSQALMDIRDKIDAVVDGLEGPEAVSTYIEDLDGSIELPNRSSVASLRFVLRRAVDEWWWQLLTAGDGEQVRALLQNHARAAESAASDLARDIRRLASELTRAEGAAESLVRVARRVASAPELILASRHSADAAALMEAAVRLSRAHLIRTSKRSPVIRYLAPRVAMFWSAASPGGRLRIAEAGSRSLPMLEAGVHVFRSVAEQLSIREPAAHLLASVEEDLTEYRRGLDGGEERAALESYRRAGEEVVEEAKRRLAADPPGASQELSEAHRWSLLAVLRNRYAQLLAAEDPELDGILNGYVANLTDRVVAAAAEELAGRGADTEQYNARFLPALYPYDVVVSFTVNDRSAAQAAQTAALAEAFAERTREEGARSGFAFVPLNWLREHGWTAVAFPEAGIQSAAGAEDVMSSFARALVAGDTVDEDLVVRATLVSRLMDDLMIPAHAEAALLDTVPTRNARSFAEAELLDRLYRCEISLAEFFRALDVVLVESGRGDLRDLLGQEASFLDAALYLVLIRRSRVESGLAVLHKGRETYLEGSGE